MKEEEGVGGDVGGWGGCLRRTQQGGYFIYKGGVKTKEPFVLGIWGSGFRTSFIKLVRG